MNAPAATARLLVVDDEPDLLTLYELTLLREGHDIDTARSVGEARELLAERRYHAVITDLRLPDGSGLDLLRGLEQAGRPEKVIVVTAYGSAGNAVEALKAGAYDYLTKPVDLRQFRTVVASALGRSPATGPSVQPDRLPGAAPARPAPTVLQAPPRGRAAESAPTAGPAGSPDPAGGSPERRSPALARLAGSSPAIVRVRALVARVAGSMAPALVLGESGTGKELVARAIHELSSRGAGPFVAVNCGAIPETLIESEFFGHRRGAFTGAEQDRAGFFQAAQGGTLFLDEIGDLPLAMQSRLLRAVQERAVRPVGATAETPVDVRIVSATHRDLAGEVAAGRFRQDLYYRLNVIEIRLPPLRERLEDLPAICADVLARLAAEHGQPPARLSPAAQAALVRASLPGNVRELENRLHRALALASGPQLDPADLDLDLPPPGSWVDAEAPAPADARGIPPATVLPAARPGPAAPPAAQPAGAGWPPPAPAPAATLADLLAAGPAPAGELLPGLSPEVAAVLRDPEALPADLAAWLDAVERAVLVRALERHRCNRTAAGARLGLTLRQIRYRMARLGIQVAEAGGPEDAGEELLPAALPAAPGGPGGA